MVRPGKSIQLQMTSRPLPPLDYASYVFSNFARIYYTQNKPIYLPNVPDVDPTATYVRYSMEARQTLLCLYNTLRPLVAHDEYDSLMLKTQYLQAITLIHFKFNTIQRTDPFETHFF